MDITYKTILTPSEIEIVEKKSRFIGFACPVSTEEEANEFVNSIKQKHKIATHNVYAYVLRKNNINKFTDDGEPSGTAGLPTLDAIRKAGFTDTAVVVTRYFGGTLLGTGGLVKAYSTAAKEALIAAKPIIKKLSCLYEITCRYDLLGSVQYTLELKGFPIENIEYTDKVKLTVSADFGTEDLLINEITSVTGATAKIEYLENRYVNVITE